MARPDEVAAGTCPVIVVTGVSGSGKSSVGRALAERCSAVFIEGDECHPPANIARMTSGRPLDDAARAVWLDNIVAAVEAVPPDAIGIVACSALKRIYRSRLREAGPRVAFLHLAVAKDVARQRMTLRLGHFMPPQLIDSQFADLESPGPEEEDVLVLDAAQTVAEMVAEGCAAFGLPCR